MKDKWFLVEEAEIEALVDREIGLGPNNNRNKVGSKTVSNGILKCSKILQLRIHGKISRFRVINIYLYYTKKTLG